MNLPNIKALWPVPVLASVVALFVVFSGGLTSAQTPEPSPTSTGASSGTNDVPSYDDLLAEELGIGVNELREAQATARDRYIDALAAAGTLTAEQAANVKASSPGDMLGQLGSNLGHLKNLVTNELAEQLGIDREALESGINEGKSLEEIAEDQGVNLDEIKADVHETIDRVVDFGRQIGLLSEEDANELAESLHRFVDDAFGTGSSSASPTATP